MNVWSKIGLGAVLALPYQAFAMELTSPVIKDGNLPSKFAYCAQDAETKQAKLGEDISPPLQWSNVPANTKSFALLFADPDAPASPDFNTQGATLKSNVPRFLGYHWVVVNIPASQRELPEGAGSNGFIFGGKAPGQTPYGLMGKNIFDKAFNTPSIATKFAFGTNPNNFKGNYGRYDGPCPPWNDMVSHRYKITLYALDVETLTLPIDGNFSGDDALKALQGHILGQADLTLNYVTNSQLLNENRPTQ